MSTRGAFGFRYLDTDKTCINSMDSDLWGLGTNAIDAVLKNSDVDLIEHFKEVSFEKTSSDFEGDNVFFMKNYKNAERFLQEGLFCEWAYILNLDTRKLEIYSGFHAPTGQGRYNQTKNECSKQYGGVALICEVSFDIIRAMFSKPKYCALAAKFYGVVNAKAEMTKVNFQYFEDLSYSEKEIEEYFAAIAKIDVAPLIVAQLQSGTKFTCNEKHFLKISDSKYAAVDLNYFSLYEFSYFEGKSLFIS